MQGVDPISNNSHKWESRNTYVEFRGKLSLDSAQRCMALENDSKFLICFALLQLGEAQIEIYFPVITHNDHSVKVSLTACRL